MGNHPFTVLPKNATNQGVFNLIVRHLFSQGRAATDNESGRCALRTQDGLTCAIGCLIPEGVYYPDMETHLEELFISGPLAYLSNKKSLIYMLQAVHDYLGDWSTPVALRASIRRAMNDTKIKIDTSILDTLHFGEMKP